MNQEYTVTQTALSYSFDTHTADPVWCAISYTYSVTDTSGASALPNLTFDNSSLTLAFFEGSDLTLSGPDYLEYIVTIDSTTGNVTP